MRWLLYIDLRRAFQLQVTHRVSPEKAAWKSHPQRGGGDALKSEFVSKPPLCPWGQDISKTGERNSTEREWERFLTVWTCLLGECLFSWVKLGDQRVYLWSPSEGFHSQGACSFLLVPGERIWCRVNVQAKCLPQLRGELHHPICKQYSCFRNLFLFSSRCYSCFEQCFGWSFYLHLMDQNIEAQTVSPK